MIKGQHINPEMLTLGRELRGENLTDLAKRFGISPAYLHKLENDPQLVNPDLLQLITTELNLPESFFYQSGEIIPSALIYRRRDKVTAKDLTRIEATVNLYRIGIEKLLESASFKQADLPILPTEKTGSPNDSAKALRKIWKVEKGTIPNLNNLLEKFHILHVSFDFGTDRVDGKSAYTKTGQPIIFTNSRVHGDRQRFTLAYQLGHLVMHAKSEFTFDKDISHEANVFAAEFLMPEKEIAKDFQEGVTIPILAKLKKKWQASMISILYRAHDLSIITDNQKRYLEQQFNQLGIRRREPAELDIPREQATLVRELITKLKARQKFTVKQLAAFFNLNEKEFLEKYNY